MGNVASIPRGHLPLSSRPYSGRMYDALKERRRIRFGELVTEWLSKGKKAKDLAEALDVPPDYVSRCKTGTKGIGENNAREWERLLKKPEYWFDKTNAELEVAHRAEPMLAYHGVLLTRAGALLAAEWEKLDVGDRIEVEAMVMTKVGQKVRDKRARPSKALSKDPNEQ